MMEYIIGFLVGAAAVGAAIAAVCFRRKNRQRAQDISAEQRARRAEQLAYAGALAGRLIHEIKNPLNTLSLRLQLLAEEHRDPQTQEERRTLRHIETLEEETQRLAAILDDFMGFIREHRLTLTDCDVSSLVQQVVDLLRPELESEGIEVRSSLTAMPQCRLDTALIKQALVNLILNAKQAVSSADTREIILRTSHEDDHARIDVIDTGRGIPDEDKDKVFEAFFSTRKGGTGLGLPTTRRIVEEHGGQIVVHSDRGRGSCFTIQLPLAPPRAQPETLNTSQEDEGEQPGDR